MFEIMKGTNYFFGIRRIWFLRRFRENIANYHEIKKLTELLI